MKKTGTKKNLITKDGFEKLQKEYKDRTTLVRKQIADRIEAARQDGDLSENQAYSNAVAEKSYNDARVSELEEILASSEVVSTGKLNNKVDIGDTVSVKVNNEDEMRYKIVGAQEADPVNGLISDQSPLGKLLCNKTIGDRLELVLPNGKKSNYEILSIS